MEIVFLVLFAIGVLALRRIAAAVTRIDAHNRRFEPTPEPGLVLEGGSLILVRSAVGETFVTVTGFGESEDDVPVCIVEPV